MRFKDRFQAGRFLASKLLEYRNRPDVLVLALPRGGVPVGREVADALHLPLDVLVVRKIGLPGYPELGIGALASGGGEALSREAVRQYLVSSEALEETIREERRELQRRERRYRDDLPFPPVEGRTVILVDDGLATGSTMEAAIASVRRNGALRVVVAAPVGAAETCHRLRGLAD
ncbi:MAG TPA: phosphoribosyltransferase family protein, partial [Candidatus Methylacidiphilales bacterium]